MFNETAKGVVSFEDFQQEVMNAFKKKKPLCVERVAVVHDFASWLLPRHDPRITGITQFRHFLFRKQTAEKIELGGEKYEDFHEKAVMVCKEYMTRTDNKYGLQTGRLLF